jgi:hypothetical protein
MMAGTPFRTMLAPIGASTGDGRRFKAGGITLADTPMPFEWARTREEGHGGAVVVGHVTEAKILTVAQALAGGWISEAGAKGMDPASQGVFAKGEMFDDVDREKTPRLAEDVAEAMHLAAKGTLGPSVDLDTFEGVPVMAGTDEVVDYDLMEAYYAEHGEEPKLELLVTEARVRAATLVSIPAFAETSRPFELIAPEQALAADAGGPLEGPPADGSGEGTPEDRVVPEGTVDTLALVAAVSAPALPGIEAFTMPRLDRATPITWDRETGRVFGHIAAFKTCHVGYADVCVTPPRDDEAGDPQFAQFHRYPVETADGLVWTGRITVGGRHAGLQLTASQTTAVYDDKGVAAWVRAYADDFGLVVSGIINPDLDESAWAVLDRRKVSGDWRATQGGLTLLEVLALSPGPRAHAEPGFPIPQTFSRAGRQVALTASFSPDPDAPDYRSELVTEAFDVQAAVAAELDRREARASLSATVKFDADSRREVARRALAATINQEG